MRWQLFFICSLWGMVLVTGRNLRQLDPIPNTIVTDSDSTITYDPNLTSEPIAVPEPVVHLKKEVLHRVLRQVEIDDDNQPDEELNPPTVIIPQGTVIGSVAEDGNYFQFFGIPYADTTSGANRFKAPSPPPTFQDTFVANRKHVKCVRALGAGYEGTEDCLVANIFTPTLDRAGQLPVMVWIKGREFDRDYEHELSFNNFMEKEVIIVTLNYRESILGFLCLGTEAAPGNAGLKDIIAGLRWVKENIEQFGGNPNDITLFGHGSGAAAVDLVTLSPLANGLVNKAISQSGNAMAPWAVSRDNLKYAIDVAEALGHVITDIEDLSRIFERTSVAALMGVINELDLTENVLAFAPCIERSELDGVEPFLTKTPFEIITDGEFLEIPFITGFVDNEGTIRAAEALEDGWLEKMEESFTNFLQSDLKFESENERAEVAQQIRQFYFDNDPIDLSALQNYITYHGETMMLVSTIRQVRARAQASTAPTYLYIFSYKGALGEPFAGPVEVETAAHSEELGYMFHAAREEEISDWDLTVADILIERWTNFAKSGIPTSQSSLITWRPFTSTDQAYLRILSPDDIDAEDTTLEVVLTNPHPDAISFWDEIYEEHFLDAESNWVIIEREDDIDASEGSGEEGNQGEDNGEGDNGDGDNGDGDNGDGDNGDGDNGDGDNGDGDNGEGDSGEGDNGEGDNGEEDNGEGDNGEEDNGEGDNGEGGNDNDSGGDDGSEDDDNAASTNVGYTFVIVALFSLLSKFHGSQLTL